MWYCSVISFPLISLSPFLLFLSWPIVQLPCSFRCLKLLIQFILYHSILNSWESIYSCFSSLKHWVELGFISKRSYSNYLYGFIKLTELLKQSFMILDFVKWVWTQNILKLRSETELAEVSELFTLPLISFIWICQILESANIRSNSIIGYIVFVYTHLFPLTD